MAEAHDPRAGKIRRNNRIVFAILSAFVLAVFANSFFHLGREANLDPTPATSSGL